MFYLKIFVTKFSKKNACMNFKYTKSQRRKIRKDEQYRIRVQEYQKKKRKFRKRKQKRTKMLSSKKKKKLNERKKFLSII